jgi:hypothetical protein
MNAQQRKTTDRFSRAILFIQTQPPELASISTGFATQVDRLMQAMAMIEQVAPDRGSGKPAKSARQQAILRHSLRIGQLSPLRRSARILARDIAGIPHLVNTVRISNTQGLLDAAKAAVRDIAPYRERFVDTGLAPDFLDQLQGRIQALESAGDAYRAARMVAASARGTLYKALQSGRDALTLLDSAIRQWCNAHPDKGMATLMAWNTIVPPRGRGSRTIGVVVGGTVSDVLAVAETADV